MFMELKVFCGRGNQRFAQAVGEELSRLTGKKVPVPLVAAEFGDGEPDVCITDNVRDARVFLINPTYRADLMWETLAMCDAAKRASAFQVRVVEPYFGYARQDKKVRGRVPITAKLHCDALKVAGATGLLTTDLHAKQIQGFFDGPFDDLEMVPVLLRALYRDERLDFRETVFVSPDDGGLERAREHAAKRVFSRLVAFVDKYRNHDEIEVYGVSAPQIINKRTCVLVDDIGATLGTLCKAAKTVRDAGATRVFALCAHPVLSRDTKTGELARSRLDDPEIDRFYFTDTIPIPFEHPKVHVVSVARHFAMAIHAIHTGTSVSELFDVFCREIVE